MAHVIGGLDISVNFDPSVHGGLNLSLALGPTILQLLEEEGEVRVVLSD
jgi:hypothetical protein